MSANSLTVDVIVKRVLLALTVHDEDQLLAQDGVKLEHLTAWQLGTKHPSLQISNHFQNGYCSFRVSKFRKTGVRDVDSSYKWGDFKFTT